MEKIRFSVVYQPTTLFSLKTSNSTNSGAKSLFLPSPYAIKMAILNQAITIGGENFEGKGNLNFQCIRDTTISYFLPENANFCVNNCFVKILKQAREEAGFTETVSFREYLYLTDYIEVIFEVKSELESKYLKKYLHKINYFGKRGCFFQFKEYKEHPSIPNVKIFGEDKLIAGLLQEYDDFPADATFDKVNSYSETSIKRKKSIFVLPLTNISSSKSYTNYKVFGS